MPTDQPIPSVPAGDLLTAVGKLRDSREKLAEFIGTDAIVRTKPAVWVAVGGYVTVHGHGVVAHSEYGSEHIALVASPHVTEALERHLEAFDALRLVMETEGAHPLTAYLTAESTVRALAAAINHTGSQT